LTRQQFFAVIVGFPYFRRQLRCAATPAGCGIDRQLGRQLASQEKQTMKRTYQPSKIRRARTHGFLVRMKSRGGRAVINARRAKGRKRLAV
jgi:large subunit ribosomal protein L34